MKYLQSFEKLFEYQTLQALTTNQSFIDWFGSSVISNEDGTPTVVYHATTKDFSKFSSEFLDKNTDIVNNYLGFYFTDKSQNSSIYVSKGFDTKKGFKNGASIMPMVLKIEKPVYLSEKVYWKMQRNYTKDEIMDYKDRLISRGHDGIVWEQSVWRGDKSGRDYTIFDAEQARSIFEL